ncbi:MAG: helix-turn-helix transcriptional regulator [Chloroflexi bacterium]|nr:helix-turn-helix transcriptional regulator [Chloroflexota bacterium]
MPYWEPEDFDELALIGLSSLGASVREARLRRGISQAELGWRVGLSQATISRLENGHLRGLRLRKLAAIAGVVQFAPRLFGPGAPPPPTRRLPGEGQPPA